MRKLWCVLACAALWGAGGCGVNKATHQKALDTLKVCEGELGSCKTTREEQATRITSLEDELGQARTDRDKEKTARIDAEEKLAAIATNLKATETELTELRKQRDAAEKRLEAFRQLQERFRKLVDTGKLKVVFRNGQMVLQLPAGVLFASGRADLSEDGLAALAEISNVLIEFKDRRFMIAGHTDNLPIRSRKFRNNWELSTARALSVVEFLIQAGFDPHHLATAGYGEFDPVAPNDAEPNRQLNRRIEIIIVPDLSELPNLAQEPGA